MSLVLVERDREGFDRGIHAILFSKEGARFCAIAHPAVAQHGDVATGTKPTRALSMINHHQMHARILRPDAQRGEDGFTHVEIQRMQRIGAVQRDIADPAFTLGQDCLCHASRLARDVRGVQS